MSVSFSRSVRPLPPVKALTPSSVRDNIRSQKKLNFHLYLALKKALYKPSAWFKGLLLPLLAGPLLSSSSFSWSSDGDCTQLEALIFGSVLKKVSIPVLPSAVALLKVAEMPYAGANSIIIRALIEKRYALPFKVIDALVAHFLRFQSEPRAPPLVWHQTLLAFAQRYKQDVTTEQKQLLKLLLRQHSHPKVTPEIRRELFSTRSRGEADEGMDIEGGGHHDRPLGRHVNMEEEEDEDDDDDAMSE